MFLLFIIYIGCYGGHYLVKFLVLRCDFIIDNTFAYIQISVAFSGEQSGKFYEIQLGGGKNTCCAQEI